MKQQPFPSRRYGVAALIVSIVLVTIFSLNQPIESLPQQYSSSAPEAACSFQEEIAQLCAHKEKDGEL